jgi:beta-glucuronidase
MNRREFLLKTSLAAAGVGISSGGCSGISTLPGRDVVAGVSCSRHPRVVQTLGDWRFQMDVFDIGEKEMWYTDDFNRTDWAKVEVPKAWDCYEEALWGYEGVGWYCVSIAPQLVQSAMIHRLIFWRVNYCTKVWLNGRFLGENIDGYLPFEFDVTEHLKPDAPNHLVLRVDNKPRIEWLPAASNIEWMQFGGILQPVQLVGTPPLYIADLTVIATPDGDGAQLSCKIEVCNRGDQVALTDVVIEVPACGYSTRKKTTCKPADVTTVELDLTMAKASAWSPDTPVLYTLDAVLHQDGRAVDDLSQRFGVRKIEVQGKRILLNGRELKIKGVNRYDFCGKFGPNPPRELVVEDLRMIKKAGVNLIRVHYPNSPETLSLFDEMGFLMMEELPLNWWGQDWWGKGAQQDIGILAPACAALEKMIRRDKNHPSIIIWSMCNECATNNEIGITVMRELIKRTKVLDKTRPVTFVASGDARGHLAFEQADIVCFNIYYGMFTGEKCYHFAQLDSLVRAPSRRHIEQQRRHFDKPIIITEFGTRGIKGIRGDIHYSEDFQSRYIEKVWEAINNVPDVSGGVLWCWADYYHRREFIDYATFGPYGVLTVDHRPKMSLESLARIFGVSA